MMLPNEINQSLMGTAGSLEQGQPASCSLLPGHRAGVLAKQIERAALFFAQQSLPRADALAW